MRKHSIPLAIAAGVLIAVALVAAGFHFPTDPITLGMVLAEPGVAVTAAHLKEVTDKLADITTKFNAKSDELATKAEAALAEAKNKGELLAATKAEVDKLLLEQTKLAGEKNKVEARLTEVEQLLARRPGGSDPTAAKSIGAQVIEDEKLKAFAKDGSGAVPRGRVRVAVKAAITSIDVPTGSPGVMPVQREPGTVVAPKQRLFVRDLLDVGQTSAPAIFWVQQTGFVNNARVVSEGTKKPESTISYAPKMTAVATIAHVFKASKQILDDFTQLKSDIDTEMRYGVKFAEEGEVLFGDGEGVHLHGIVPQAQAFVRAFLADHHNRIDDIRLAMLQSQLARLPATGIVMHFTDWARVELTKNDNGDYVFANPLRLAGETLWGLPVVPTEIPAFLDHFLAGAFRGGAKLYDREEIGVEISTENNDDFEKNMITGRCEERVGLAVKRPEAFTYGQFIAASG